MVWCGGGVWVFGGWCGVGCVLVYCAVGGGWRQFFRPGGLSLFGVTLKVWEGFPSLSPCGLVGRLVGGGLCVCFGAHPGAAICSVEEAKGYKRGTTRAFSLSVSLTYWGQLRFRYRSSTSPLWYAFLLIQIVHLAC